MSAGRPGAPHLAALLVLLAVLLISSGPSGLPSAAAPAPPQPQATVQQGAGRAGQSPTILGDINNDGIVDIRDYGVWRQNFGQTNCGNPADLDSNCIVDIRDYGIWRANFGHTAGPARPGAIVPGALPVGTATPTPRAALPPTGERAAGWGVLVKAAQALGITLTN